MLKPRNHTIMENTLAFAQKMDETDPLRAFRNQFFIPKHQGKETVYFTGNSLGLQPKTIRASLEEEMKKWEELGVEGHFTGTKQWFDYHKHLKKPLGNLVGAKYDEVTVMNGLSANLHFLLVSFYRPNKTRYKILMEGGAFPSDQYVVESQTRFHGFDHDEAVVEIFPREGEFTLRTEDIIQKIKELGAELALVFFGGVNYYTGQFFDIQAITKVAHEVGAMAGFDLAHTTGNLPLQLHDWDVDFAAWCSYKYLNSSPGGVSGIYIHEKHHQNPDLPRFAAWWGYDEKTRFLMKKGFIPEQSVDAWQLSNVPVLLLAAHWASLQVFEEAGIENLRAKSLKLTAYLEFIIRDISEKNQFKIQIITPNDPQQRGCQLSLIVENRGKELFDYLSASGVIIDWREPDVIRMAPVPLYNSFEDVYRFGEKLEEFVNLII